MLDFKNGPTTLRGRVRELELLAAYPTENDVKKRIMELIAEVAQSAPRANRQAERALVEFIHHAYRRWIRVVAGV